MHRNWTILLGATLIALIACKPNSPTQPISIEPAYIASSGSVPFDISRVNGGNEITGQWTATYTAQGKTAHFRIVIDPSNDKNPQFASGKGKFVAEPGSDASTLIPELKNALEAKSLPTKVLRTSDLPFEYVSLGDHLSQISGGGFNTKPAGHWTALKVFVGADQDEAEVFLNINPVLNKAEFSIKDADYGDPMLAKLAQVL
jgi:hypothetical protein